MTPATTITGARRRAPPATTREAGQRLGHFRLLERIGQGGMGTVFAAYDERLKRKVALKLIRGQPDIVRRERMLREAQAMATLSHPNVVTVYEADEIDEQLYLAMELIDGQTLRQWAKGRPWREVLTAYIQAGRGLAAAHAVGLVHRDFKPDNVMVATGPDGSVQSRVLDFGLARRAVGTPTPAVPMLPADASPGSMAEPAATPSDDDPSLELTSTGEQVGTPAYMAPEQLLGHPTTPRSDQFSFCIALFEAIHGHRPFPHVHGDALSRAVLSGVLRPAPSTSRVPRWVHAPIERGLAQDPDHRHPSMDALLTALQRDPTRARRVGMGAGVLAVVLTAGAGGQRLIHTRAMQRCEDEAAAISETWGTGDTTALADGFASVGRGDTERAWARTAEALDDYASAWSTVRHDACVAAEVEQQQSPQSLARTRECLDEARDQLGAIVSRLSTPDAEVVHLSSMAVTRLPPPAACADERVLATRVALPEDLATREVAQALRARLARIIIDLELYASGSRHSSLGLAQALLDEAEGLGWPPLVAEARFVLGKVHVDQGNLRDAEALLEQAFFGASQVGDEQLALRAANNLAFIVGAIEGRAEDGLRWTRHAQLELDRLGLDRSLVAASTYRGLAASLDARGEYEQALDAWSTTIDIVIDELGQDHLLVTQYLRDRAITLKNAGETELARSTMAQAVEIQTRELGPRHPMVASSLEVIGGIHSARGEYDQALAVFAQAREIVDAAFGPDHPRTAGSLSNVGLVYLAQGQHQRALAAFEQARARYESASGPDFPQLVTTLNHEGAAQQRLGQVEAARESYRRARVLAQTNHGPQSVQLATALVNLGGLLVKVGDYDEAHDALERAAEIWKATVGPRHPNYATTLLTVGNLHQARHEPGQAATAYEHVLAIQQQTLGPEHPRVGATVYNLGNIRSEQGRHDEALALHRRALAIQERVFGPEHLVVASTLFGLARAQRGLGHPAEAVESLERVLAIEVEHGGDRADVAETRFHLAQALVAAQDDRPRALELAEAARDALPPSMAGAADLRSRIDEWIADHRR